MVVDDVDETRELFAEVLTHAGYHAIMARSGSDALARLEYVQPDLVLTDLDMPEMGGDELIGHLRREARFKTVPIIVLTGIERAVAVERLGAHAAEARDILRKPVTVSDLVAVVAAALANA
jgi:CheY-like chemotaxis protein